VLLIGQWTSVGVEAQIKWLRFGGWVCDWSTAGHCWSTWSKHQSQHCTQDSCQNEGTGIISSFF